jgi:spore maturation protein CgeB
MKPGLKIAFYGSSLVSSYWNGAATYYRGILQALALRGHKIVFYEPDAFDRQKHRDIPDPDWARVAVYPATEAGVYAALEEGKSADVLVKASGVGAFDELLEREILTLRDRMGSRAIFWDVDAPATLERMAADENDPFRDLVSRYDFVLTYGGGDPVASRYRSFGAQECVPIYNALDPETHRPAPPDPAFESSLGFLGNRLPDREARVHEFFFGPASKLPHRQFVLGGAGWDRDVPELANVRYIGHVYTRQHNAFNCTPQAVLNVSRESMARFGFSPATRVFEAAGAGACILTDEWEGIDFFFEPDREILVASSGEEVAALLDSLTPERARSIGDAALKRALAEHTYDRRAGMVDSILYEKVVASGA